VVLELIARSKRDIHVASDVILTSIRSLSIPTPRVDSSVGWAKRSAAQQAGFASHHVMLGFTAFSPTYDVHQPFSNLSQALSFL
jgi:hypothetical protein